MTQKVDLVGVMAQGGRYYLFEQSSGRICDDECEGYETEEDAIKECRAKNRERQGFPPDSEAFNR